MIWRLWILDGKENARCCWCNKNTPNFTQNKRRADDSYAGIEKSKYNLLANLLRNKGFHPQLMGVAVCTDYWRLIGQYLSIPIQMANQSLCPLMPLEEFTWQTSPQRNEMIYCRFVCDKILETIWAFMGREGEKGRLLCSSILWLIHFVG